MDNDDIDFYEYLDFMNIEINFQNQEYLQFLNDNINNIRRKYHVRQRINPIEEFDNEEFIRRFRFSKDEVKLIYDLLNGNETLEPMVFILIFLHNLRKLYLNNKRYFFSLIVQLVVSH